MQNEKKKILRRVYRKLQEQHESQPNYLAAAAMYTGLHPKTLIKLDKRDHKKLEVDDVNHGLISTIRSFYTNYCQHKDGGKVPTTYELFDALVKMNKLVLMDIRDFRKLLQKMGFVWQKSKGENSPSCVVVENPVLRFKRLDYLTKIRKSRAINYDAIYFIGEVAYSEEMVMNAQEILNNEWNGAWQQKVLYAVGVKTVTCLKNVEEFSHAVIEDWVTTDLCPILSEPSVIVAPDSDHYKQKLVENPTLYSTKPEIAAWLDYHNVPYDSAMSKYELYSIAEEYTDLEKPLYKIDGILKARGHVLLRLPNCIDEISPAVLLHQIISKISLNLFSDDQNTEFAKTRFKDVLLNAAKDLKKITTSVCKVEDKVYATEKNVDDELDRLMNQSSLVPSAEKDDSDMASCSDSE